MLHLYTFLRIIIAFYYTCYAVFSRWEEALLIVHKELKEARESTRRTLLLALSCFFFFFLSYNV